MAIKLLVLLRFPDKVRRLFSFWSMSVILILQHCFDWFLVFVSIHWWMSSSLILIRDVHLFTSVPEWRDTTCPFDLQISIWCRYRTFAESNSCCHKNFSPPPPPTEGVEWSGGWRVGRTTIRPFNHCAITFHRRKWWRRIFQSLIGRILKIIQKWILPALLPIYHSTFNPVHPPV